MGTIIAILIGFAVGVATGMYKGRQYRQELEAELNMERSFDTTGRKPKLTEASVRKRVEQGGPVPSDPDVGDFLDLEDGKEPKVALGNNIKNEDAQALLRVIAKLGPTTWISKSRVQMELGWGFRRYQSAMKYLLRNRYVKQLDAKKNRGAQLEVK